MAGRSWRLVIAAARRVSRRGVGYGVANRVCGLRSSNEEGRAFVAPVQPWERFMRLQLDDGVSQLTVFEDALDEASLDSFMSIPSTTSQL